MTCSLYLPRWNDVLIELYNAPEHKRYCQKINRLVNAAPNHLRAIVKLLEDQKLVEIVPGRLIKKINVTEKGEKVAINILKIRSELRCQ